MGSGLDVFSKEELEDYKELPFIHLSENEICAVFKRFRSLDPTTVDNNRHARLPKELILKLPDLESNPFKDRICAVFSSTGDGSMDFDDVLLMMSVFSEHAPKSEKIEYAFCVYDLNDDSCICREDIANVVRCLCGDRVWDKGSLEQIVQNFFKEADMDDDSELDFPEFENMMSKAPDFVNSFRFRPIS